MDGRHFAYSGIQNPAYMVARRLCDLMKPEPGKKNA